MDIQPGFLHEFMGNYKSCRYSEDCLTREKNRRKRTFTFFVHSGRHKTNFIALFCMLKRGYIFCSFAFVLVSIGLIQGGTLKDPLLIKILVLWPLELEFCGLWKRRKKSRIWETSNLLTDADHRTDTMLERLRDLSKKISKKWGGWRVHFGTSPVFRASRVGDGRSAPTPCF